MNVENRRTCTVCGKKYKTCKKCNELTERGIFAWRGSCDTKECFLVLMILNDYFYKQYTKQEAREFLELYLTEDMKPYTDNTRKMIEEIFEDDAVVEETIPESTEIVEETSEVVIKASIDEFDASPIVEEFDIPVADKYYLSEEEIVEEKPAYSPIEEGPFDDIEEVIAEPTDEIDKVYDGLM